MVHKFVDYKLVYQCFLLYMNQKLTFLLKKPI